MSIKIRRCTAAEADGRGAVHYQAWKETYSGLMPKEYLDGLSLGSMIQTAREHTDNTFVATSGDRVVGFITYVPDDGKRTVELTALYVLKSHQGQGIGRALLDAVRAETPGMDIRLFVLKGNEWAIGFYHHMGFSLTGTATSQAVAGGRIEELEMLLHVDT